MLDAKQLAEELQKLIPTNVNFSVPFWSDSTEGGRQRIIIIAEIDSKVYATAIIPLKCNHGMYVGSTEPSVFEKIGITFTPNTEKNGKSTLTIGGKTFLIFTQARENESIRWVLLADLAETV